MRNERGHTVILCGSANYEDGLATGAVQVMATPSQPTKARVRWPGGKITTSAIPPGAREISVDADGKLAVTPGQTRF